MKLSDIDHAGADSPVGLPPEPPEGEVLPAEPGEPERRDLPAVLAVQGLAPQLARLYGGETDPKAVSRAATLVRIVETEIRMQKKLHDCDRPSLLAAVMAYGDFCHRAGLEPGAGVGAIIPFKSRAKFIPGYLGYVQACYRAGARGVWWGPIYPGQIDGGYIDRWTPDEFEWANKLPPYAPAEDESPSHYYARVELKSRQRLVSVLSRQQVDAIRKRAPSGQSDQSAWVTDFEAMACKSCFRRLAKRLPISPVFEELERAAES